MIYSVYALNVAFSIGTDMVLIPRILVHQGGNKVQARRAAITFGTKMQCATETYSGDTCVAAYTNEWHVDYSDAACRARFLKRWANNDTTVHFHT